MNTEKELFEELASIYDHWLSVANKSTSDQEANLSWTDTPEAFLKLGELLKAESSQQDFEQVISELIQGVLNSTLVVFDGGTKLAEKTNLNIVDDSGQSLPKNLHEEFVSYLMETGRLK
jgi:hypothetical protein